MPFRPMVGPENGRWKGGRAVDETGYVLIRDPDHPQARSNGYVREHILIAEKALGKPLPHRTQVHHFDCIRGNNDQGNHVICQDDAYHKLLHQRTRAYEACGHGSWLKCKFCHEYDDPGNLILTTHEGRHSNHHRVCKRKYDRQAYQKRRGPHGRECSTNL